MIFLFKNDIISSLSGFCPKVFIEIFLWLELWPGAVVVMDNLPAHKLGSIQFLNNFSINWWFYSLYKYTTLQFF